MQKLLVVVLATALAAGADDILTRKDCEAEISEVERFSAVELVACDGDCWQSEQMANVREWSTLYQDHYKDAHVLVINKPGLQAKDTKLHLLDKTKYQCGSKEADRFVFEERNFEIAKRSNV